MDDDRTAPRTEEPPLYRDPFAGEGACPSAAKLDPAVRARVTQACPRCGAAREPWAEPGDCLLEGVALDELALEREAAKGP